jgi:site-specific DNA-methyltransferase (adenine-specific)
MLAQLDNIGRQLAKIASIDDAKEVRDKAEALGRYYKQQRGCKEIERQATIIRLRAERMIGQLLSATVRRGSKHDPGAHIPAGITGKQSATWQLVAKVPQPLFDEYMSGSNLSTKGLVKIAHDVRRQRANARGPASGGNIFTGDMWQLNHRLPDDSVDLFLSDPPYAQSDLDCYGRLAELAASKLKPGGLCLAYCGSYYLPQIMERMGEHLIYYWTFALVLGANHARVNNRRVFQAWKPVLAFAKGKPDHEWLDDVIHGSREKQNHDWQQAQSESEYLIEKLTRPGELVVDPYCGSGTTLAAAKNLNRRWMGCEIDATTARGARRRVAA